MKITDLHQNIEQKGNFQSTKFTAEWSGHATKLISDTLYSEKIEAVIRELSTNAVDAQIEANSNRNPEVHLPTLENPNFIIRDFGIGLSDELMHSLYTVYFKSTKQDSNKFNGQFGLGRMSFLSYNTKTCMIESYKDGVVCSYSIYYGPNSVPTLSKLSEKKTDEPNGLKITVPAKTSDISKFKEKAEKIYRYFDIRPTFTGNKVDIQEDIKEIEGPGFYIAEARKSTNYPYYTSTASPLVVMANVAYPLKLETQDKTLQAIQNHNLVLLVPTGKVSFDIGREKLSYNEQTIQYLTKRLNEIVAYLSKDVQGKVDKCKCKRDAILEYWKSPIKDMLKVKYNGVDLPKSTYDVHFTNYPNNTMKYDRHSSKASKPYRNVVPYSPDILILERDKRDVRPRINHLLATTTIYCLEFNDDTHRDKWMEEYGINDLPKLSDYKPQKLPKNPKTGLTRTKYVGKLYRGGWSKSRAWVGIDEFPKDYVMVHVDKYDPKGGYYKFRQLLDHAGNAGVTVPDVVGVTEKVDIPDDKDLKKYILKQIKKKWGDTPPKSSDLNTHIAKILQKKLNTNVGNYALDQLCEDLGLKQSVISMKKYPLLFHLQYSAKEKDVEEYIDLIDGACGTGAKACKCSP